MRLKTDTAVILAAGAGAVGWYEVSGVPAGIQEADLSEIGDGGKVDLGGAS